MALSDKRREEIREEEMLRLTVRSEQSHNSDRCSRSKRRRSFWWGVVAGVVATCVLGAMSHGGRYGKKCGYKNWENHHAPQVEAPKK